MKFLKRSVLFLITLFIISPCSALIYWMPHSNNNIVGQVKIIQAKRNDTIHRIARRYEMGYDEILHANRKLGRYRRIKSGTLILIPSIFILPHTSMPNNIVVNVAEKRLFYFPPDRNVVVTEPVGIGRKDWLTPLMRTKVVEKIFNPIWTVPDSIKEYEAKKGHFLPDFILPGPDNPLGKYALRLGQKSILIHGTNQPYYIGRRISSGCIRMYPEDINHIFHQIENGTPVEIVNAPYQVGVLHNKLYLAIHLPFKELKDSPSEERKKVQNLVIHAASNYYIRHINWHAVNNTIKKHTGIPNIIGE